MDKTTIKVSMLVVGGGIGGLAAALAAAQSGVRVVVLEKNGQFAELGAGIQLAPNGSRMLDHLGILGRVEACANRPKYAKLMDAVTGKQITALDFDEAFVERFRYPYLVIHRRDLIAAELEACISTGLITLQSGETVVSIEELRDSVRVKCARGSVYETELLVGADGLWSQVRRTVNDDGGPVCGGNVAYRGLVPIESASGGSDIDGVTLWIGPNLRLMEYAVRHGRMLNQVAIFRSNFYRSGSDDWGTTEELEDRFAGTCDHVRTAIKHIDRGKRWFLYDREPASTWARNRIMLLGDAVHPMLPHGAQGACQALEDAVCLGASLRKHPLDPQRTFSLYQQGRMSRCARVQTIVRWFGEIDQLDESGRTLHFETLSKHTPGDLGFLEWLYGCHDCEWLSTLG